MTVKVVLDGIAYDAAPEVARALEKAQEALEAARKDIKAAKSNADKEAARADAAEARVKQLEGEIKAAKDGLGAAVRARSELQATAAKIIKDEATVAKLDSMTDDDIKAAVILATNPAAKLDGKSADYIQAAFDIAISQSTNQDAARRENKRQIDSLAPRFKSTNGAGGELSLSEQARRDADASIRSAWRQ